MLSMPIRACCLAGRNRSPAIDNREQTAEAGEVYIRGVRVGEHGLARDEDGEQEQNGQEGISAEDVSEGELVVPLLDGSARC